MSKSQVICKRVCVVLMFTMFLTIFASCNTKSELQSKTYNYKLQKVNLKVLSEKISYYKTDDNGYGFWNEEANTPDMYSTYYSVMLLKKAGYNFEMPNIRSYNLSQIISTSSLFDLSQYCELFKNEIKTDNSLRQKVYDYTMSLKEDNGIFKMGKGIKPDTLSNYCAVKILKYCSDNYDFGKIKMYTEQYLNKQFKTKDLNIYYGDLLNIYDTLQLMKDSTFDEKIRNCVNKYFSEYQLQINNLMKTGKLDLLTFNVYFQFIKKFNLKNNIPKEKIAVYISSLKNKDNGYGYMKGSQTDLQITYDISEICDYYNIDINYSSLVNVIMRHQLVTTKWFIVTSIVQSSIDSTYYAYSILKELGNNYSNEIRDYVKKHSQNKSEIYYYALNNNSDKEIDATSANSSNNAIMNVTKSLDQSNAQSIILLVNDPKVRQSIPSETKRDIKEMAKKYLKQKSEKASLRLYLISLYNLDGSDSYSRQILYDTLKDLLNEFPCSIESLYASIIALESSTDKSLNLKTKCSDSEFLNWCKYVLSETDHGNGIFCYNGGKDKYADFKSIYFGVYAMNRLKKYL